MNKKTHIAIYVNSLKKNGTERVVANLMEFLVGKGYRITLVTPYVRENEFTLNPAVKRIISEINAAEITPSRIRNLCRRFMKLRRIWQSEKPEVILSFIGLDNVMALLSSRFLPLRMVAAVRGPPDVEYASRRLRIIARFVYRFADGVLLQTENSRAFFPVAVARKATVIKNTVNPVFFRPRYMGEREKTIVASTRIHESKNHRMLIEAFTQIAAKFPEYRLIIYGEGELRQTLTDEVLALGMAERISLPGHIDRPWEDLYRASVYVLCSNTEGVPNTLIEAMLLGLCCISTDFPYGGAAGLIKHGENGLLTPTYDTAQLAWHLEYLLSRPEEIQRLGQAAHLLQAEYDPVIVNEAWEQYLTEWPKQRRPRWRGERQ